VGPELFRRRLHQVLEVLELGEAADQADDVGQVARLGGADGEGGVGSGFGHAPIVPSARDGRRRGARLCPTMRAMDPASVYRRAARDEPLRRRARPHPPRPRMGLAALASPSGRRS
jgi:hypothetical protein